MSVQNCEVCDFLQMDRQEDYCIRCERDALARALNDIDKTSGDPTVLARCEQADREVAAIQRLGFDMPGTTSEPSKEP